jgi:hypothetical protein
VRLVRGFDTDTLGTFTREVPRAGTQLEAARRKAKHAAELARLPLGLGSEGALAPEPFGIGVLDVELVVLVDAARGLEIVGRAEGPGRHVSANVASQEGLFEVARGAGFPAHALVLRPDHAWHPQVEKGLSSWDALEDAFARAVSRSETGVVFLENDLRADQNPTRMALIHEAVRDCVRRMQVECERCGAPGFGVVERIGGLPCRACGRPTRQARAERLGCVRCAHRVERALRVLEADPSACDDCNP